MRITVFTRKLAMILYFLILIYITQIILFSLPYIIPRFSFSLSKKKKFQITAYKNLGKLSHYKPNSVVWANFRIYVICAALASYLFFCFLTLNFWHCTFSAEGKVANLTVNILLAYLILSGSLVAPIFCALQATLQHKRSGRAVLACLTSLESIMYLAVFYYLLLTIVPLIEFAKLILGLSNFSQDLATAFLVFGAVEALIAICPIVIVQTMARDLADFEIKIPNIGSTLLHTFSFKNRDYNLILNDAEFNLGLLNDKSSTYLIKLIEVAKHTGHTEKAAMISEYLLERE